MAQAEELAQYVASIQQSLIDEERRKGRNYMVPPPPRPGEIMICQQCGKPMYPQDFDKDPTIRRHEFKWQIHHKCEEEIWNRADRETPGLLAERKTGFTGGRAMYLGSPKSKHS